MLRGILIICVSVATVFSASAQLGIDKEYVEPPGFSLGMTIGICDLWADIGTQKVIDHYTNDKYFNDLHAMGGLFGRYTAAPALAMRLGVNYGTLYAHDNWNNSGTKTATSIESDYFQRYLRNQNIRARTWEGYFMFEFNPLRLNPESRIALRRFQPYLMAGVGYFHFKPQVEYITRTGINKGFVDVYDLNIEGAGLIKEVYKDSPEKYKLWQLNIPLGIGVKWDIGRRLALGVEYVYRYCFTDYLDNVSGKYVDPSLYTLIHLNNPQNAALAAEVADQSYQILPDAKATPGTLRGNPGVNDAYSTFGLTLIFKIKNKKYPWWY